MKEGKAMVEVIKKQKNFHPEFNPDFIMVDGEGTLHKRKFGSASYVGIKTGIPTISVTKESFVFMNQEEFAYSRQEFRKAYRDKLRSTMTKLGDFMENFHPSDNKVYGYALKTSKAADRCIYISVGHNTSLLKAKTVTLRTCIYKIPEPIRQADACSRQCIHDQIRYEQMLDASEFWGIDCSELFGIYLNHRYPYVIPSI